MGWKEDNEQLIGWIKRSGCLRSEALEKAIRSTPRHLFVPKKLEAQAYVDDPLPIGEGQTISQPSTVSAMTEALDVRPGQKVLEIGTGSGWQAALLAKLAGREGFVWTIERFNSLAESAKRNLENAGIKNVKVILGDGSLGLKPNAPFDRIIVTAGCPDIPAPLLEQLKVGGKLVLPIGDLYTQQMFLIEKVREGSITRRGLGGFRFVPLVGKHGFDRER
jgi:protein-L-isoaspartate(D-aspartate) O-methyltransferase